MHSPSRLYVLYIWTAADLFRNGRASRAGKGGGGHGQLEAMDTVGSELLHLRVFRLFCAGGRVISTALSSDSNSKVGATRKFALLVYRTTRRFYTSTVQLDEKKNRVSQRYKMARFRAKPCCMLPRHVVSKAYVTPTLCLTRLWGSEQSPQTASRRKSFP